MPGLGDLAWREAELHLPVGDGGGPKLVAQRAIPGRNDLVLFAHRGSSKPLLKLRISEDAFIMAARAFRVASDERGLRQIYAAVRNSEDVIPALNIWRRTTSSKQQGGSFRVIARTVGRQTYMRREVSRAVSDAVKASWPGRWQMVDDDADLEIWATLVESELLCALRLSDVRMRQREKAHHLPASLRPALAAALVSLTDPRSHDVFLDPMAGAGTILMERAAVGPFAELHGGDLNGEALRAMQANMRGQGGQIQLSRWDARKLPLAEDSVDKAAVNLPFGKQVSDESQLPALYQGVLAELMRVLRPGGRLVALAGDPRTLEMARAKAARGLRPGPRHRVIVLGQPATICEYTRT